MLSPAFDECLRLLQCVEEFSIQRLVTELSVKGHIVSVISGATWFDKQHLHTDSAEPSPDGFGRELWAVI